MKITLYKDKRHVVMQVMSGKLAEVDDFDQAHQGVERWDEFIVDIADELENRQGVRRVSYDTWWWDERKAQEAEEYITYFYLKHGK